MKHSSMLHPSSCKHLFHATLQMICLIDGPPFAAIFAAAALSIALPGRPGLPTIGFKVPVTTIDGRE